MAKNPPAFQLYSSDFVSSTQDMDAATVGSYIRLLCFQWDNRSIPADVRKIARICGVSDADFTHIWADLSCKFIPSEDGRLVNPRLDGIRTERDEFIKQAAEHGKAGAEKRYQSKSGRVPNGEPDRVPHENPNGVGMALQSPSSLKEEREAQAQDFSLPSTPEVQISAIRPDYAPTTEHALAWFAHKGCPEYADAFMLENDKIHWQYRDGSPIKNWEQWAMGFINRSRKAAEKKASKPQRESKPPLKKSTHVLTREDFYTDAEWEYHLNKLAKTAAA